MSPLFDLSKRPTRHSYSSLKKFKECPAAYGYSYIMKLADDPTGPMMRGTRLHALCEDYMRDRDAAVPYDIRKIGLKLFNLREHGAVPEQVWLLDKDWEPTEDPDVAKLKAIVDVHWLDSDVLKIHDYKSGRPYPDHDNQLELYALMGLRRFPSAKRVESSAIYIDSGNESQPRSLLREMFPYYAKRWVALVGHLDSETRFLPTPGVACGRCQYRTDQGGPCAEWAKVKPA